MQRFNGQLINQFPNTINGNAAAGAQVTIRVKSSGALASLYATNSLSGGTLPNPITADAKGYYGFYAPDNVYALDVNIAGTPQLEIQLQDVGELVNFVDSAVAQVQDSGTEPTGQSVTFAIVGEDNSRTWLEMNEQGKPTDYAQELINEGIDTIKEVPLPDLNQQSFAIVGEDDSRTWLEADYEGKPTAYATAKMIEKLPAITSLENIPNPEFNDQSFAIVGEDNSQSWLEADQNGKPTDYAIKAISEKMPSADAGYYVDSTGNKFKTSSGPNIVAWGDSMTAGATGIPYTTYLQSLLQNDGKYNQIYNRGVGGESSITVAARANATPITVLVDGGIIPESGSVVVSLLPINGVKPEPLRQSSSSLACTVAGIAGTLSQTNSVGVYTYRFQRAASGVAVQSTRPETLYFTIGEQHREDIAIIWVGQNTPAWVSGSDSDARRNERAILDSMAIIRHLRALDKRYLVISRPSGGSEADAEDAKFYNEFGQNFIAIRQYIATPIYDVDGTTIINCYGLQDAGITPIAQDLIDISQGKIPVSFRNDSVHWKAAGYEVLAKVIYKKLIQLGWI